MIGDAGPAARYHSREAHQGEAEWIITFGDLMSLLFCFFVLLTTLSTAPKNCNGLASYLERNRSAYKNFELRNSKLECVITLPSDFLFQTGQDQMQRAALERLRPLFRTIAELPEHERDLIIVEGHTDNLPIRTPRFPSNWELSTARATNVAAFMRQLGIPEERMSIRAFADSRPRVPYSDEFGKARQGRDLDKARQDNRRVEIILVNRPARAEEYGVLFR
jgi:chemotaxis protein MotB